MAPDRHHLLCAITDFPACAIAAEWGNHGMADDLTRRYRGRVVFGPFAAVDPREIQALESEIGCRFPADYRAFLEVAGGGSLHYSIRLPPGAGAEAIEFGDLYRIGRDSRGGYGYGTLAGEYRRRSLCRQGEKAATANLLPIARDGGGDTLYLELGGQAPGRLAAFVHGLPSWTGLTEHDIFTVISGNFDAYLDSLFIEDDVAHMTWDEVRDENPSDPWRRAIEAWLDDGLPGWRGRPWASRLPDRRHDREADFPGRRPAC